MTDTHSGTHADVRDDAAAPPDRTAVTGRRRGGWNGRRKRRRGEQPMVPEAQFESYYGRPVLNKPTWHAGDIASYLFSEEHIRAAKQTGAEAIHPGYGFLAENADFAEAVNAAELVWVGPPPDALRAGGDKLEAKRVAQQAGVPVVPSGEPEEVVESPWDTSVELFDEHLHCATQPPRLLTVETCRVDVALELFRRHGEVVLRPAVLPEQRLGDAVHVHVGRLRGEHHRHEQLERAAEAQRDARVGMRGGEPLDDRPEARALRADAFPRLLQVAACHRATLSQVERQAALIHT